MQVGARLAACAGPATQPGGAARIARGCGPSRPGVPAATCLVPATRRPLPACLPDHPAQIPANMLMARIGGPRWLASICVVWGEPRGAGRRRGVRAPPQAGERPLGKPCQPHPEPRPAAALATPSRRHHRRLLWRHQLHRRLPGHAHAAGHRRGGCAPRGRHLPLVRPLLPPPPPPPPSQGPRRRPTAHRPASTQPAGAIPGMWHYVSCFYVPHRCTIPMTMVRQGSRGAVREAGELRGCCSEAQRCCERRPPAATHRHRSGPQCSCRPACCACSHPPDDCRAPPPHTPGHGGYHSRASHRRAAGGRTAADGRAWAEGAEAGEARGHAWGLQAAA